MAAIVEAKNVSFTTQNVPIVDNFSFEFEEGKTTALVGPSGSGKSTVLKLCAGLLVPDSGQVIFRGNDVYTMNRQENSEFRLQAAVVFQDSALWANQSLEQILELPLRVHFPKMPQKERIERVHAAAAQVGYRRNLSVRPAQLSMGEQKLIAFARAIICQPSLLFLDEWTESLDESAAQRLQTLVKRHQQENKSVIFVSHDFRIIRSMADYIIMILDGKSFHTYTRQQLAEDENLAQYVEKGIAS